MRTTEWTIISAASTGLRRVFASPASEPLAYVEKNFLGMFGLILAIGAFPEIPIHHLLIPSRDWIVAIALDFALVYSTLWVLGIYGVMVQRPHDVQPDRIVFHRGPFAHVEVARDCIECAAAVTEESREARRRYPGAYYMGLPGTSLMYVRLREPVRVRHTYPLRRERMVRELLVPADNPRELCVITER